MFFAAVASLSVGACTTAPEGGYRIDNQNDIHPELNSVRVIDGELAGYKGMHFKVRSVLDVENVTVSTTATGFKRVSVELRNKGKDPLALDVRTSWYDDQGRPVDAAQSWSHIFAKPMSMAVYEQSSKSLAAAQYYVEVRAAQ